MTGYDAVDDFACAGGWDTAAALLGITSIGVEIDPTACATARAAGHARILADVATIDRAQFAGIPGYIASAPCTPWSAAGKRLGLDDAPALMRHAEQIADAGRWIPYDKITWADAASPLLLEIMRAILEQQPEWIALENVRDVLPYFALLADWLRGLGYRVWCGVLDSEMYGVPQTRDRAILTASLDPAHAVSRPPATHQRYRPDGHYPEGLFELPAPVTMAQALGWGFDEPSCTVSSGCHKTGGAEPFANAGYRKRIAAHVAMCAAGATSPDTAGTRPRDPDAEPSATITGKGTAAWVRFGTQDHSAVRAVDEPAATVVYGKHGALPQWIQDAPATTVQGDPRIAPRGHHDRQFNGDTVRVSPTEAAILQSFPPDYPWQGSNTAIFGQIGNAVPPLLGVAVLGHLLRIPEWRDICRTTYAAKGI